MELFKTGTFLDWHFPNWHFFQFFCVIENLNPPTAGSPNQNLAVFIYRWNLIHKLSKIILFQILWRGMWSLKPWNFKLFIFILSISEVKRRKLSSSSQDIPLDRNEKVYVIGNIEKFWVQVKKVKTGEIGFVPSQILDWIVNISLKYILNILCKFDQK